MKAPTFGGWLQQWFDRAASEPIYRQLYRLICRAILEGYLKPGARLPSSRSLAADLDIARNTVIQVYEQLAVEGYVHASTGRGTYVKDLSGESIVKLAQPTPAPSPSALPTRPRSLSRRGQFLADHSNFSNRQSGAFIAGVPDVAEFPFKAWNRIQGKQWRNATPALMSYSPAGGYPPLRQAVSDYLNGARSVNSTQAQVVITTGIHQAVDVSAKILCEPGDIIWIEEPSYWGIRNLLLSSGLTVVAIRTDQEGISPTPADLAAPPKLIVITPSHQYPLGMVMSLARRKMLLEYARKHSCWIIEDDYDSEFRYANRPLPSLQGLDTSGLVLYAGSFSKTLFPGLRVGYLVVPAEFALPLADAVAELYREGQLMTQAVLASFINEGHLASHIRRMRGVYAERRTHLIEAIERRYGGVLDVVGQQAGLHLVLGLDDAVDDVAIAREALELGIIVRPLSLYYMNACPKKGLLLGYAPLTKAQIDSGFALLSTVIDRHLLPHTMRRRREA